HDRVVGFLLDPHDGILLDQGQQAVRSRRHRHALLVDLRAAGRVDRHDRARLRRRLHVSHSGPEIPPSLRMRQKWTARKIAATSGKTMMWRTYKRSSVFWPTSSP